MKDTQLQTIEITHGPIRRRLQTPVTVAIPAALSPAEADTQRYIIRALSGDMPRLIPFALQSPAIIELARYLRRYTSSSCGTLYLYIRGIHRYCLWVAKTPDQLILECRDPSANPNPKVLFKHTRLLEDFIGSLQADGLAPQTILNYVKAVKALYRANGLRIDLPYKMPSHRVCPDRAPTPEELQRLIDVADQRGKVIVSCLALGGFREGTLCRLKYYHIKEDLERGVTPIHVHVEAEITKGKYRDYNTFLGQEAAEYIKTYLDVRRRGSPRGYIPPETITDESPLIRDERCKKPRPISLSQMYNKVHELFLRAGLVLSRRGRFYTLRPHSIRKYFRTQLAALGVDRDYIEYMMGHSISVYHDIEMKGIEFLRNIYAASGISIRPKTQLSRIEALKEIIRAWGMNPEEILTRKALASPHRIYSTLNDREEDQVTALRTALKDMLKKELLDGKSIQ